MKRSVDIDILEGCAEIISNYFVEKEFFGKPPTGYQRALYNALLKAINGKKKMNSSSKDLSTKLGQSVFAEKLRQALKEAELKKEKQQMEKANEKKKD